MMKLPRAIRFFRKPDHIAFLVGYGLLLSYIPTNLYELIISSFAFFTFTLCFEIYEIWKGNIDIKKLDHFTFVIGYIMLIGLIFYQIEVILVVISSLLFTFTLGWEIYRVRKLDLENQIKDQRN